MCEDVALFFKNLHILGFYTFKFDRTVMSLDRKAWGREKGTDRQKALSSKLTLGCSKHREVTGTH